MRVMLLVLGMLVVLGLVALANDGSVPWPQGDPVPQWYPNGMKRL